MDPFFGDLRLGPEVRKLQVRAGVLVNRVRYVAKEFGDDAAQKVRDRIAPETKRIIDGNVGEVAMIPIEPLLEYDHALFEAVFGGKMDGFWAAGIYGADHDLTTIMKAFLWLAGHPAMVIKRIVAAFPKSFVPGHIEIAQLSDHEAQALITDCFLPYHLCSYATAAWVQRAVELAGGKSAKVSHEVCVHRGAERCRWDLTWQ